MKPRPKLLIFDVNETLLDLKALQESVAKALGGKNGLAELWFTTMLHHSLVETMSGGYREFGEIGAAVMTMVAMDHDIELSMEDAKEAINPITSLPAHEDVKPGLKILKDAGYRMITLTNSSQEGVNAQMKNSGLGRFFEQFFSIGETKYYKPDLRTYRWAAEKMNLPIENCMLIAAHGWDITGAMRAGMRTAFIARPGKSLYPLAGQPEIIAEDLISVARVLTDF